MRSPLARLLVVAIHLYRWMARRVGFSRTCLYRESCSAHVEAVARTRGFTAAWSAMMTRFSSCRPGYTFEYDDTGWWIATVDAQSVHAGEASGALVAEARACRVPVDSYPK